MRGLFKGECGDDYWVLIRLALFTVRPKPFTPALVALNTVLDQIVADVNSV